MLWYFGLWFVTRVLYLGVARSLDWGAAGSGAYVLLCTPVLGDLGALSWAVSFVLSRLPPLG
jgi:hypothetical protein